MQNKDSLKTQHLIKAVIISLIIVMDVVLITSWVLDYRLQKQLDGVKKMEEELAMLAGEDYKASFYSDYVDYDSVVMHNITPFHSVLGLDGEVENILYDYHHVLTEYFTYINGKRVRIAGTTYIAEVYTGDHCVDIDNDGIEELVCNFHPGSYSYVYVYKRQENQILYSEACIPEEKIPDLAEWVRVCPVYDKDSQKIKAYFYDDVWKPLGYGYYDWDDIEYEWKVSVDLDDYSHINSREPR